IGRCPGQSSPLRPAAPNGTLPARKDGSGGGRRHILFERRPIAADQLLLDCGPRFELAVANPVPGAATRLAIVRKLDHLVEIEAGVALTLPIEHDGAIIFVETDLGGPALDQIIVPPDALVAIGGRKIADFGASVVPRIIVGLVIGEIAAVGKT